jgi:hypothetical protein
VHVIGRGMLIGEPQWLKSQPHSACTMEGVVDLVFAIVNRLHTGQRVVVHCKSVPFDPAESGAAMPHVQA